MDLSVRNVNDEIITQLKREASEKGISLTTYVKQILSNHCLGYEITSLDEKYRNLVQDVIALYDIKFERMERLAEDTNYMIRSLIDVIEEEQLCQSTQE